jgi:uncharacterized Zn finger protein (UPF0148 family)
MSNKSREKMQLTVELMRRGAVMLKEACPTCNGVQVKYRGKTYCTAHEDLSGVLTAKEVTYSDVAMSMKEMLLGKLKESMVLLENEKDPAKQDQLVSLMSRSIDLLNKLEPAQKN